MINKKKRLLIESGFYPSQLLWILIIASSYCKKKNIKEIIIDKKQSQIIKENILKEELKKFKIIYTDDLLPFYLKKNLFLYLILLPKSLLMSLTWNIKNPNFLNWYDYQFYHSIIDTYQSLSKDGTIKPKFFTLLKSIYLNLKKEKIAKYLSKKNISAVITSHNVYTVKTFNSVFRKKKIPIFCQAVWGLFRLPYGKDDNWNNFFNFKLRKIILNNLNVNNVNKYWKDKISGKGDYFDSNISFRKKNKDKKIKNLVMLHIFRDSPFINLDKKRIFLNYIDWIDETIKIIKNVREEWYFKIHPNSKSWGENPMIILNKLLKKNEAKNIFILKKGNIRLMKNLKRVVTYSGSVTEEAISLGIKPIVISDTAIYNFDKKSVLKPKNLIEYKKMLSYDYSKILKSNTKQKLLAKKFIYCNEKIMTLRKDLNSIFLYRSEKFKKKIDYMRVKKDLKKNRKYLKKLGILLASGLTHTLSKEGLKITNL